MSSDRRKKILDLIDLVPTLPLAATSVLKRFDDRDVSVDAIARMIQKDPSLTVSILKLANSAFYGFLGRVSDVRQAIVLVGLNQTRNIVLAVSLIKLFEGKHADGFKVGGLWRHSIACGFLAKKLGEETSIQDPDGALLVGGLIHDIGKLVIYQYLHHDFRKIISMIQQHKIGFSEAEKDVLGYTHYHIGAELLRRWNFPEELIAPVFFHHSPWSDSNHPHISATVYYANRLTKLIGFPSYEKEPEPELSWRSEPESRLFLQKNGFMTSNRDIMPFLQASHAQMMSGGSDLFSLVSP
ncbi:MAG: HDOD domain-containing protein [Deltaproteobacteria bacterium]|nr:HDOD domain-containing protein [Deltaproteobacteria bacterium]